MPDIVQLFSTAYGLVLQMLNGGISIGHRHIPCVKAFLAASWQEFLHTKPEVTKICHYN